MIFRRVITHMKNQHWTGVFIELVIVILGVFIGLQASNWNQARESAVRRAAALKRLHDESEQDVAYFKKFVGLYDGFNADRSQAIRRLLADDWKAANADRMSEAILTISFYPAAAPPRSAYDEVIASGSFGSLGDANLRKSITNYYSGLAFLQGQIAYFREISSDLPGWKTPGIKVLFAPGTSRERRTVMDFAALSKNPDFIQGVIVGNSDQRGMAGWWHETLEDAEKMCLALSRATGRPCAPLKAENPKQ